MQPVGISAKFILASVLNSIQTFQGNYSRVPTNSFFVCLTQITQSEEK